MTVTRWVQTHILHSAHGYRRQPQFRPFPWWILHARGQPTCRRRFDMRPPRYSCTAVHVTAVADAVRGERTSLSRLLL